jgi:hypothetical protein
MQAVTPVVVPGYSKKILNIVKLLSGLVTIHLSLVLYQYILLLHLGKQQARKRETGMALRQSHTFSGEYIIK